MRVVGIVIHLLKLVLNGMNLEENTWSKCFQAVAIAPETSQIMSTFLLLLDVYLSTMVVVPQVSVVLAMLPIDMLCCTHIILQTAPVKFIRCNTETKAILIVFLAQVRHRTRYVALPCRPFCPLKTHRCVSVWKNPVLLNKCLF